MSYTKADMLRDRYIERQADALERIADSLTRTEQDDGATMGAAIAALESVAEQLHGLLAVLVDQTKVGGAFNR